MALAARLISLRARIEQKMEQILLSPDPRRRRGRPPDAIRRTLIADAAIRLLAENGSRGLSHRRVDKEAGLPIGTTTHYASTRGALLLMAARRLSDISTTELQPFADFIRDKGNKLTAEDVARETMNLWQPRLRTEQLFRVRAEMSALLSQDFEAEMRELFQPYIERIEYFWQQVMTLLGSKNPEEAGAEFNLWWRGLFYMLAVRGGIPNKKEFDKIEVSIAHFLRGMLDRY